MSPFFTKISPKETFGKLPIASLLKESYTVNDIFFSSDDLIIIVPSLIASNEK